MTEEEDEDRMQSIANAVENVVTKVVEAKLAEVSPQAEAMPDPVLMDHSIIVKAFANALVGQVEAQQKRIEVAEATIRELRERIVDLEAILKPILDKSDE